MSKSLKIFFLSLLRCAVHLALLWLSFWVAYEVRFHASFVTDLFPPYKGIPGWDLYQRAMPVVFFVWIVVTLYSHFYTRRHVSYYDDFFYIAKEITALFFILMSLTFMYRGVAYSRLLIGFSWFISIHALFVSHIVLEYVDAWILSAVFGPHRVMVVGKGKSVSFLKNYFHRKRGHKPYFYEQTLKKSVLERFVSRRKIDEMLVVRSDMSHETLLELASVCDAYDVDFKFIPDILDIRMGELIIDQSFGIPLLHLKPISLHGFNFYYKRVFDILFSIFCIAVLWLPLLIISLMIVLETPGGIFFLQKRIGLRKKMFYVFKFRTMVKEADQMMSDLKHLSDRKGPVFKMKNDPRITKVGKFLRMTSLDEVPQIINVLKGDMSIVGPRPQVLWEAAAYDQTAAKRLNVMPGITGLWQVSGRAALGYMEMINLDLYYLENWSPGLDISIILKTVPTILSRSGAY